MANDKREEAWNKAVFGETDVLAEITNAPDPRARNILYIKRGFNAGYAAATAEGIPQADGWVVIRQDDSHYKFQTLPQANGQYVGKRRDSKYYEIFFINQHQDKWLLCQQFEAWMPIPPYQRQSSEGE